MHNTICNVPWIRRIPAAAAILIAVAMFLVPGCADQKRQAESLVRAALEHSDADRPAEAIQCLDRAIALNPGLAEAFYLRGTCNSKMQSTRNATEDLSAATRLKPKWDEAWCALGIAQMTAGDTPAGITSLTKALELNAKMSAAWEARARGNRELGHTAEELHDLSELLQMDSANSEALLRRGTLLSESDPLAATEDLSKVISLRRDNATAWMQRGLCYNRLGDTDRALADLNLACRLRPDNFRPWLERGRCLRTQQRSEDAISDLSKAAELGPNETLVRLELGRAYLDNSNPDAAESNLLLAERLSPKDSDVQLALAQTDIVQGRREKAVERLRGLLSAEDRLSPALVSATRICLAQVLQETDETDEAMAFVEQVLETQPADTAALQIRAALLANSNRREEAIADYTQLISAGADVKSSAVDQSVLERGRLHLEGNDFPAAIADLTKYLAEHPDHVQALTLRAQAYLAQNEAGNAVTDLTLALLKDSDQVDLYLLRSAAFDQFNETTAALADLQKAASLTPTDSALMQRVAERLFQDQQYARAAKTLDTLAAVNGGQLTSVQRLLRGRARLADGNPDGAYEDASALSDTEFERSDSVSATDVMLLQAMIALRRHDDIEALRVIRTIPQDSLTPEILLLYGQALARQYQPQEAIRVFSQLLESDASNTAGRLARSTLYLESADWQAALDDANQVLRVLPDDPRALQIRGISLFQNDQFRESLETLDHPALLARDTPEARWMRILCCGQLSLPFREIEELNALLGIAPTHESARLLRADLLERLGHFDDAIADLSVVVQQDPKHLAALKNRGMLNQRRGHAKAAVVDFAQAIELSPDDADLYYRCGIARHQVGQADEARKDLDKALDLDAKLADAWYVIGNLEAGRGQMEVASAAYAKAVEIQPEHAAAWYNRGNLLFNQSKLQQAVDCWTIAITLQPDLFRAYNNRAAAYDRLGRDPEALADYEKTLLLNPGFVRAWDNLAWLLATSDHKQVRDAARAMKLATKACELSDFKDWTCINTLATCCAENQDFEAAVKWAKQARAIAPASDRPELDQLVAAYEGHLKAKRISAQPGKNVQ
jgi:tetratricopeptide (TPR) repeat protein